jgi:hypothetical protein
MVKIFPTMSVLLLMLVAAVVVSGQKAEAKSKMQTRVFGKTEDGTQVDLYILTNKNGVEATISTYGATLQALKVLGRRPGAGTELCKQGRRRGFSGKPGGESHL